MEILSVSVANGIYPASESDRDTNPGASLANYKVVRRGDIVYNSMRMWQGAVGASAYDGIVSPAYVVARPAAELDSLCFGYLLKAFRDALQVPLRFAGQFKGHPDLEVRALR